ncbi:MAG: helix-turn-helix transcriptional regulator [Methylotenera sp.]|nr:helix-turn-helix transcriptional regulator [Methylotenera sp.]MDO9234200.1 helix-turn-helix transcriptional regulator [Methylotenera sp.]MDP2403121.1 helix-turn-helix transcriptional regulator [Methylotenera sp.]MDP3096164.1 helix-turn-helix transcriptional regulator [Methylotenera sp.]MDZ4223079.1 helix-turn-helix transcriptional regulator [Methylotenera sp.]
MLEQDTSPSLCIGKRIAEIATMERLNQKSLAQRLGVSQGFLSSVINDQKIPGSEFLFTLKNVFGVSADWVLTGEGGMYGGSKINIQLQKEIRLYIAIARVAVIDGNSTAKVLLLLIKENRLQEAVKDQVLQDFLNNLINEDNDFELVTGIYNSHVWLNDSDMQRQNILAAAIEHFELRQPVNIFKTTSREAGANVQINIAGSQRNALRDYHEK